MVEKYTLKKHVVEKHPESQFLDCEFKCDPPCHLQEPLKMFKEHHIAAKHMEAKFTCNNCNLNFRQYYKLTSHITKSHNGDMLAFRCHCSACDTLLKSFEFHEHLKEKHFYVGDKRLKRLRRVKKIKHDASPIYSCQDCDVKTEETNQIIDHIFKNHEAKRDLDDNQKLATISKFLKISCKSCNFLGTFSEFNVHKNTAGAK